MSRKNRKWISTNAGRLRVVLALLCLSWNAGVAFADGIEGAWELVGYELEGNDIPVSGLLVFTGQEFGMIYTMGQEAGFGRAHAGTYELQGKRVQFDVKHWIQKTADSTGFVPGKSVAAAIEWRDGVLILRFDGGSVQKLRPIESAQAPLPVGPWRPKIAGGADAEEAARAALVVSGDRFVLLHLNSARQEGQAYGGTLASEGRAAADWAISVESDSGSAAAGDTAPDLTFRQESGSVGFRDDEGEVLRFERI